MTFSEFAVAIRRRWWFIVIIPLLFAATTAFFLLTRPVLFAAVSQVTVTGEVTPIAAVAEGLAAGEKAPDQSIAVTTSATSKTINIKVQGPNAEACVALSNKLADAVVGKVVELYGDKVKTVASHAADASAVLPPRRALAALAFVVGVVVAILLIIVEDGIRKPLRRVGEIEDKTKVRSAGPVRTDEDYVLLVRGPFMMDGAAAKRVCIIPVGSLESASAFATRCVNAAEHVGMIAQEVVSSERAGGLRDAFQWPEAAEGQGLSLLCCNTVNNDAGAAYYAASADTVIVLAVAWKDRQEQLSDCLARLALAGVEPGGIILMGR